MKIHQPNLKSKALLKALEGSIRKSKDENSKVMGFCSELNAYLNRRFHYKKYHARVGISGSILADTKAFHLYLRWKPLFCWQPDTLVIASFSFFAEFFIRDCHAAS